MCKTGAFLWGLAAGMVAGAMIEIVVLPRPRPRKTAVGKAMQRMGNAMDQALESVAENTSDAQVAPLLWAAAGGVPAVLVYRGINTLDSMIGYRSPRYLRFGWAAARLDDVANFVAARATGSASIVKHGQTGYLVSPGAITGFADDLERYCRDPALRALHGAAGLAESAAYQWDAINQAVADTYLRLIRQKQRQRG